MCLWKEAGRAGVGAEHTGLSSPETAVRKRASAIECRRFRAAMAQAEATRRADGGDEEISSSGDDEEGDLGALVRMICFRGETVT